MTTLTYLCKFNNFVYYQYSIVLIILHNYINKPSVCVCVYTSLNSTTSYIPYPTTAAARDGGDIQQIVLHTISAQSHCRYVIFPVNRP
jgi:hypothetical protein